MKSVIITLDDANKLGISGAEKLTKSDELVILYVKGKKSPKAELTEALEVLKCNLIYEEMASNAEYNMYCAFYAGYNKAKNRDTYIVSSDKDKLNSLVKSNSKVYVSFKSVVGTSASAGKGSSTGKATTATGKSATGKTSAKNTSTKKSSKKEDDLTSILTDLAAGKIDKEKITDTLVKAAMKKMK